MASVVEARELVREQGQVLALVQEQEQELEQVKELVRELVREQEFEPVAAAAAVVPVQEQVLDFV